LSVSVSYSSLLLLLPFAKFINCIFCKVLLFNTVVTACFFQLLLLNGYVKHSGYVGSFLAAYCVTLTQGPVLSGPIVGLKSRAYTIEYVKKNDMCNCKENNTYILIISQKYPNSVSTNPRNSNPCKSRTYCMLYKNRSLFFLCSRL
jgi:hypothetical protein